MGPEIEHVVQVDVRQQGRDDGPLGRAFGTDAQFSVFQDPGPEPLAHQPEDALVADPVLQETDQPLVADRVEGPPDRLPTTSTTIPSK
jgi:hypothetical protein